ncbi:MAG: acetate--CoA ligase family protein [Anaerolineae bacterium]|nr:acetate--CoA ligase family protein [Anaerolineae bacterium]
MLEAFFSPKSVAVVGASRSEGKLGYAVLDNLIQGGFAGEVYPINPQADEILGYKAYESVVSVPDPIDLAVIVVPYKFVPDALRACGEKKIPAVIVISAGFRESGVEGMRREQELLAIAEEFGIRLVGPNCLGVIDTFTPLNATFAAGTPPKGPVGFMSQSGALGTAILDWSLAGRIGFSKFVSLGNKADVDEVDVIQNWVDDPETKVIALYSEGLNDGQKFIRVARAASKRKPIVVVKSGVTQSGARAVSSHTGSLAGADQAYSAGFHQAGVLRAGALQELFDFCLGFGYQPHLKGDRVGIVTNAGGPGILATDALEKAGLKIARLDPETTRRLDEALPEAASSANPVDVLGDAKADRYRLAIDLVAHDPNVDAIIVILTPQAMTDIPETAQAVVDISRQIDKPVLGCFMGEARVSAGVKILNENGVPNFAYPSSAARTLSAMYRYYEFCHRPPFEIERFEVDNEAVRAVIDTAREEGRLEIGDAESRAILKAYGFRVARSEIAPTADAAVRIATEIGYPVVLKIASPDILHKTDVGGVKVGLENAAEVRDAFELMVYRANRYVPGAKIWGCLVQEMMPGGGFEVLVGMNRDPQFGPLVTFGMGGIYVEALKDVTFRVAPFARWEAEEMLGEIRAKTLLDGVRGEPPKDRAAIIDTLLRINQLVTDFPEILELDINPLTVYEQGAIPLDMRLILEPASKRQ